MTTFNDFGVFSGEELVESGTFGVVTCTNETNGSWLLIQFLKRLSRHSKVLLVSCINDRDFYVQSLKRQGVNASANPNINVVSVLGEKPDFKRLLDATTPDTIVILENIDLWVAGGLVDVQEVAKFVTQMQLGSKSVLCLLQADFPLIDPNEPSMLTTNHTNLGVQLLHQAHYVLTLRPLPTGRADDVTGRLRVSRGPKSCFLEGVTVDEREYLYFIKGDQVKISQR